MMGSIDSFENWWRCHSCQLYRSQLSSRGCAYKPQLLHWSTSWTMLPPTGYTVPPSHQLIGACTVSPFVPIMTSKVGIMAWTVALQDECICPFTRLVTSRPLLYPRCASEASHWSWGREASHWSWGREATERATKSREVDLSRLQGFISFVE